MSTFLHYAINAALGVLAAVGVVELGLFLFGGFLTDTTDENTQDDAA